MMKPKSTIAVLLTVLALALSVTSRAHAVPEPPAAIMGAYAYAYSQGIMYLATGENREAAKQCLKAKCNVADDKIKCFDVNTPVPGCNGNPPVAPQHEITVDYTSPGKPNITFKAQILLLSQLTEQQISGAAFRMSDDLPDEFKLPNAEALNYTQQPAVISPLPQAAAGGALVPN